MGQVVSDGLYWAGWRILQSEYFPVWIVFVVVKPALMVFRGWHRTGNLFIQLAILFSLWSFPEYKHVWHLPLVFTSTLSKIEYNVEPDRSLQLCWISAVGWTEFTTFVQTLDLLFVDRFLVNHASYLSCLSEVFHEGINNLVGFCKSGVTDDWELLAVRWRAKKPGQWRHEWISLKTSCSKSHLAFSPRCKRISDSHWALASTFPRLILRIFLLQDCPATLKNGKYYVSYALFTVTITKITKVAKAVYKYFIALNTHLPMKIFSSYFVDLLVLMGVALSTILFLPVTPPQIETFSFAAKKFFSDLQNFSTRNSPSVFPYLVKLNDNGSYRGLREPIRKPENHYPELKIYYIYI